MIESFVINITGPQGQRDIPIKNNVYLEVNGDELTPAKSKNSILVTNDDEIITIKILEDIPSASFKGHDLKNGGIYFLEEGEKMTFGPSTMTLHLKEVEQAQVIEEAPVQEPSQTLDEDKTAEIEVKEQTLKDVTSIDVSKLLNPDSEETIKEDSEKEKTSTGLNKLNLQSVDELSDEEDDTLPGDEAGSVKELTSIIKPDEIKKLKKNREKGAPKDTSESSYIVGPLTRLFAIAANIIITIGVYQYFNFKEFHNISIELHSKIAPFIDSQLGGKIPLDIVKFVLIFVLIELCARLLFSVSTPLFLIGATTSGGFITKRIKALIRFPFDLLSTFLPVLDFPIIFGRRTFKELLTFSYIRYRFKFLKYFSFLIAVVTSLVAIIHPVLNEELLVKKEITHESLSSKATNKISGIKVSKDIDQIFLINGTSKKNSHYLLINKNSADMIEIKEVKSIKYHDLSKYTVKIPFFNYRYPFLNSYYNDKKLSKQLREDAVRFFDTGLGLYTFNPNQLLTLDLFSISESIKLIKALDLNITKVTKTDKFVRYISEQNKVMALFFDKEEIRFYSFRKAGKIKRIPLLKIGFTPKEKELTVFDKYLSSSESSGIDAIEYLKNEEKVAELVRMKGNKIQKKLYNSLLKSQISSFNITKHPEHETLKNSLKTLEISL